MIKVYVSMHIIGKILEENPICIIIHKLSALIEI